MSQELMSKHSQLLSAVVKYTVATVLITVPLLPKFPFINVPGTFVAIRLEDLVLAFCGLLIALIYMPKLESFVKNPLNQAVIIFIFSGLLSLFSAIFITSSVQPHIGFLHWLRRIEYLVPLYLGITAIRMDRKNLGFFIKTLLVVVFVVFVYGFGQKYFNWPIIITQNEEYSKGIALRYVPGGHINSTFAGHYDLGSFLVLVLPILVTAIFVVRQRTSQVVFSLVSFLGLWLLVNTASRISMVSYLLAVCLALIFAKKVKGLVWVFLISLLFVGFSTSLISRYERILEITTEKLQQFNLINYVNQPVFAQETGSLPQKKVYSFTPTPTPVFEDRSTNIRLNVEWPRAVRAFAKNPLLGTGYSSINLATDNDYLRLFGEVGIIGFFAFFLIIARILVIFVRRFPLVENYKGLELAFVVGLFAAIPGIFVNAFFIDVFEASKFAIIFWLLVGFAVSLLDKSIYEHNN
jgi:hypothetical protein